MIALAPTLPRRLPCLGLLVLSAQACSSEPRPVPSKVYVCAQTVGQLNVIDGASLAPITSVVLGDRRMPHNVTVSPDRSEIWATNAHADGPDPDEVVVLDPQTDAILARIAVDPSAFAAHVVIDPSGRAAFVSGWGSNLVYRIDVPSRTRLADIVMPPGRNPHGLRLSADGAILYTANSNGSVGEIDAATGAHLREFTLPGPVIQVAVGDGAVFASVSSPPSVGRIELASGAVTVWPLPDARALAQIELGPAGAWLAVAEQGDSVRPGNKLYLLHPADGSVIATHEVGLGAHGLALSPDGTRVFVTGMLDDSIAAVDLEGDPTVAFGLTDRGPSGIAVWTPPEP